MARLVFLGCVAYLAVGLGQLVVGTIMEPMVDTYGVRYGDGGQLVMNQFLGGMVGITLAPWLIGRIGKKTLLLSALVIMAIAQGIYSLQPDWGVMLAVGPLAGFGFGTTEAVVGSFVIGSALGNANVAMSRIEVFFGVGALLMPFAGAALISSGHWDLAFVVVGVVTVITIVMWLLFWPKILDRKPLENAAHEEIRLLSMPHRGMTLVVLAACSLFFVVYVGFEMSFIHYLPSLLVNNNGLSDSTASLSLSIFWGAMVIGRLVSGHAADRWGGGAYMLATCVAAAVFFVLMGGLESVWATFVLTFLAGLAMSGMFAIALVFANRAVPGMTERTTSLLMACGGIGGALMPRLTGWFLDENGADATRWLFAGMAVLMLAVIAWALLSARSLERLRAGTA
ncbi:MFS transporter [Cohnella lupini]|uniref:FHS family glucose/mannose:H+ symporter-like MFS transporter n=1 Tax=Cohnella lupini TaxID=1294267 RepID=A0A3D9HNZ4_9BACL|nr:MFS transporter [Cohnella lupini]RED51197.1 FHS family glucose/mannose:H+ symporter-like MFS transporter [Cohnella lupini]